MPSRRRKPGCNCASACDVVRDERAVCAAERASPRGGGATESPEAKQTVRWSRAGGTRVFTGIPIVELLLQFPVKWPIIRLSVEDAFDTFRNQRVWAAAASESRFPDHYICPLCRTEVALAAGPIMRNHFRHVRGTDHDECERYSKNFGREVPLSQYEYEHLDAVLVASRSSDKDGERVSFAVRFRPAKRTGRVKLTGQVDFFSGGQSIRYAVQPSLRQQYFRITAPEKSYLVKAMLSDGGNAQYPIEGFDDSPVVFRATDGEAVRIAKHRLLKSGRHLVVNRKPISTFHASLIPQSVRTLAGLHAYFVEIPENPAWQLRQNVKATLGFEITSKMAVYGFLCPCSAYELAPDCWEVPKDSDLAILIRVSRECGPRFTRLLVQYRESGRLTPEYLPWNESHNEFVIQSKAGSRRPELLRVGLATAADNQAWFLLEIDFSEDVVSPQCARIQFQFASADNLKTRLKWSAHELQKMLVNVARGSAKLLGITNRPDGVELVVTDSCGQRAFVPDTEGAESLTSFLRKARLPCVLSASGHPDVFLSREKPVFDRPKAVKITLRAPRCRREARFQEAFKRGRVSEYSVRAIMR